VSTNSTLTKSKAPVPAKDTLELPEENNSIKQSPQHRSFQTRKRILRGVTLQLIVLAMMAIVSLLYYKIHSLSWPFPTGEEVAAFNFIGVTSTNPNPSFLAVIIEIFLWSATGVLAHNEYSLTQLIITHKEFNALEQMSKIVGELIMGVSITVAVIAFFRSVELSVAQINISLKAANVETVIAISFILGFYHDHTRRLLGAIRQKITDTAVENRET
jgi:type IV secretory pathway VirB3-like protein